MDPTKHNTGGETLLLMVVLPLLFVLVLFVVGGMKREGFETQYDSEIMSSLTQ